MRAVVYYGPGQVVVEERPEPQPAPDNLILAIRCCAICGSDLKLATIGNPRCEPPRVIGHELVGEVIHAGEATRGFALGDRVTLATTLHCGTCAYCVRGLGNMCPNARPISNAYDGAFAEYMEVPAMALRNGNALRVPDAVPDEPAALSEPLSCAINAQDLARVSAGDRVLIIGGGPLGALHSEVAKARGAAEVMVAQRSEPRLSMLRCLHGITVIDSAHEDVLAMVRGRTEGLGADAVIVCAPAREVQESALRYARKGGAVSLFASLPRDAADITLDSRAIHYGELKIVGASDSRPEHVAEALRLLDEHLIDVQPIITHRIALADMLDGLQMMRDRTTLKIMVYPHGPS